MTSFLLRAGYALLCLSFLAPCARSQSVSSLANIFSDKEDAGLETVKNEAISQSRATPFYKSNGVESVEYQGYFRAASDQSALALLSDDGASVWIDGEAVLSRAGVGQGFENFATTFYPLGRRFQAGRVYRIRILYTNTLHLSDSDVDGISLWAYNGGGELVESGLSDGSIQLQTSKSAICAGKIADAVHQARLTATVKDSRGALQSGVPVSFSVENSHAAYPSLLSAPTAFTDAQGQATVFLTSSQQINATATVKAQVAGIEAVSSLITMQDAQETWSVTPDVLFADGQSQATVALTLKHNDQSVAGHRLQWRINRIWNEDKRLIYDAAAGTGSTQGYGSLAVVTSATDSNGFSSAIYTVGTEVGEIEFAALDYTMVANSPRVRTPPPFKVDTFQVYTYVRNPNNPSSEQLSASSAGTATGKRGSMKFYVTLNSIIKSSKPAQLPTAIDFVRKRHWDTPHQTTDAPSVPGHLLESSRYGSDYQEYWSGSVVYPLAPSPAPYGWNVTQLMGLWHISVRLPNGKTPKQVSATFKIDKREQIVRVARSWIGSTGPERTAAGARSEFCGGFTSMIYEHLKVLKNRGDLIDTDVSGQHDYMTVNDNGNGAVLFYRSHKKRAENPNSWVAGHVAIRDGQQRINNNSNTTPGYITSHEGMLDGVNPSGSGTDYFDIQSRSSINLDED